MSRDDMPTLIICLACGGNYEILEEEEGRYRMRRCRWCHQGGMDRSQQNAWLAHCKARRDSGELDLASLDDED